jgi:hypothetical protein
MTWEWRRVKRSFDSRRRQEVFTQLQACNTALLNCGLEKRETQPETENRVVNVIRARFNEARTKAVREDVCTLHQAIESGMGCTCSSPQHLGHIQLDWYERKPVTTGVFALSMSSKAPAQASAANTPLSWRSLSMKVEPTLQPASFSAPSVTQAVSPFPAQKKQPQSKSVRFKDIFRSKLQGPSAPFNLQIPGKNLLLRCRPMSTYVCTKKRFMGRLTVNRFAVTRIYHNACITKSYPTYFRHVCYSPKCKRKRSHTDMQLCFDISAYQTSAGRTTRLPRSIKTCICKTNGRPRCRSEQRSRQRHQSASSLRSEAAFPYCCCSNMGCAASVRFALAR